MSSSTPLQRVFIVHGYGAGPDEHWFPWLATELVARGINTTIVDLPESDAPSAAAWASAVSAQLTDVDETTGIVAHSLGCVTALRHLDDRKESWRLGNFVAVAGFLDPLPAVPELDEFITASRPEPARLVNRIGAITVIRSDDDPLIPAEHTDRLARELGVQSEIITGAGHFLGDEGVTQLPPVLVALVAETDTR